MRRIVSLLTRRCLLLAAPCFFFNASFAQNPPVGTVEGRVFNPATGGYLEMVRVTVEGTSIETFTDSAGHYRLTNVPAGTATIRVFRTGVAPQTVSVSVVPGGTVQHDLTMSALQTRAESKDAIVLDQFIVSDSKEMDEAAIAINTQRFAPNVMNVVTGDEFGAVADGGVGEVLKSLPGISISRGGFGDAYEVSMNGVPPANVPVTVGGFNVADATRGTGRSVGIHMFSLNSFSRIEVVHTPTPESSGSALAGSVNMVPRSAFERSTPQYHFSLAMVAAGRSIEPGTYTWNSKRLVVDLNGEYYFYKRVVAFTNFSNLGDAPTDVEMAGPSTPAHAQFRQRRNVGALWTFGIKGTF